MNFEIEWEEILVQKFSHLEMIQSWVLNLD